MNKMLNTFMKGYLWAKRRSVHNIKRSPHSVQRLWFDYLIGEGIRTEYGKKYSLNGRETPEEFAAKIPITYYENTLPYIERMMMGEENVLWPGVINHYSQSSGTTSDRSKYIPVSAENLEDCHIKGFTNALSMLYDYDPSSEVFRGKCMTLGGSMRRHKKRQETVIGDVSAIILENMPMLGKMFYVPDMDIALMDDWEVKIEKAARSLSQDTRITMFGGVPTWNIVLFNRILDITGKDNMLEVWPDVHTYIHGGVGFTPYRKQFERFFPSDRFNYQEIYNASEGFFAAQDHLDDRGLLLMLDNGVYYEFIPLSELGQEHPKALPLNKVELNSSYAIVITTNAGLWRYVPGDTIEFTSLDPYKIIINGRTKHFINAFGEELIVDNTEQAIKEACMSCNAAISDYTVAPVYLDGKKQGRHQWLVEWIKEPPCKNTYAQHLDLALQKINSDYEAKRSYDLALTQLELISLPQGTFHRWMQRKGKYGAQNKIPRLSNDRSIVDDILNNIPLS